METRAAHHIRTRVANACDICKLRKIKCSGVTPCGYCVRRQQPEACHYTAQQRRRPRPSNAGSISIASLTSTTPPASVRSAGEPTPRPDATNTVSSLGTGAGPVAPTVAATAPPPIEPGGAQVHGQLPSDPSGHEEHEETEVPREARLLCDPQGKLIFVGDCAPLSFFQTVRRLVTSRVDGHAFAPESSGYSSLENVYARSSLPVSPGGGPPAVTISIKPAISAYLEVTAGLIDLFDNRHLLENVSNWAAQGQRPSQADPNTAVYYLVLAIGCQKSDENTAQLYFDYARDVAFTSLSGNLGISSVQAFILITLYMLCACQINGAFIFFGLAVRTAYSIGLHRTAVNARFGSVVHRQRDRLWKSLRVVDLFLSTSMGRPPCTSDVDCTVPYRDPDAEGREKFDLLNASAQIFLITEGIVVEVYSRRKISPQLTEGISRELRDWSTRWLQRLKDATERGSAVESEPGVVNGACQVLASYYYAVILVSRPFLMVELRRRLSEGYSSATFGRGGLVSGKSKLADACIDAASLMVDPVRDLIERGLMTRRAPLIVSWLFASSLVLGLGLLGGFGRAIEKYCRASIAALEYFAEADAHALQYSLIAKSLLSTALEYLEKKEMQDRLKRAETSSQLFGLIPRDSNSRDEGTSPGGHNVAPSQSSGSGITKGNYPSSKTDRLLSVQHHHLHGGESGSGSLSSPRFNFDFESTFMDSFPITPDFTSMMGGGSLDMDAEHTFGELNLFPLLETDGHIDLANYF